MRKIIIALSFVLFVISCSEDGELFVRDGVNGRWQLEATKISPGSLVLEWTRVENGEVYWFSSEGSYQKIVGSEMEEGTFRYEDDFLILNSGDNSVETRFYVRFEGTKMILAFVGCIEECSYRYKRIG